MIKLTKCNSAGKATLASQEELASETTGWTTCSAQGQAKIFLSMGCTSSGLHSTKKLNLLNYKVILAEEMK